MAAGRKGQLTTSGRLKHKQEGGRSPGLGWTSNHSEPPRGRKEDGNLSPSMSLHRLPHCTGSKGVLGQAGLGFNRQGSPFCTYARVCVCACCALNTAADQAHDPVDSQSASQSTAPQRDAAALCCATTLLIFPHCARVYLDALLFFPTLS